MSPTTSTLLPFPVGQKVICVRDDISATALLDFKQLPVLNQVYTIAAVGWGKSLVHGELGLGVRLAEIELRAHARDAWFCLSQFRLLDDEEELQQLRQPLAMSA